MLPKAVTSTPSRIHPKVKKHKEGTYFRGGTMASFQARKQLGRREGAAAIFNSCPSREQDPRARWIPNGSHLSNFRGKCLQVQSPLKTSLP